MNSTPQVLKQLGYCHFKSYFFNASVSNFKWLLQSLLAVITYMVVCSLSFNITAEQTVNRSEFSSLLICVSTRFIQYLSLKR